MQKQSTKICTKCQNLLPTSQFSKYIRSKDGLNPWCKTCKNAYQQEYRKKNLEKVQISEEKYRLTNPNRKKSDQEYYRNHTEKILAYGASWRVRHPDLVDKSRDKHRIQNIKSARRSALLVHFNLTEDQYDTLLMGQGYVCAICLRTDPYNRRLAVDHVHGSSPVIVRGLLCQPCNTALGKFQEKPHLLKQVIDYIQKDHKSLTKNLLQILDIPQMSRTESQLSASLKYRYGIGLNAYNWLLDQQQGLCAICGQPPRIQRLSVDHCHSTKVVRGLLCRECNFGLSGLKEDVAVIQAAYKYLQREVH